MTEYSEAPIILQLMCFNMMMFEDVEFLMSRYLDISSGQILMFFKVLSEWFERMTQSKYSSTCVSATHICLSIDEELSS